MRSGLNRRPATVATLLVAASLALAACGSGKPAGTPTSTRITSIVSAPVRTVHTGLGRVPYRVFGRGRPLVMVMGYAGTMEVWDPRLVDDLAKRFRVVIFDNAGVGQTQALAAPLTIDAMADQTSALITALHLGRPDVLGWSMGSMIAEALAVQDPSQVRRLVLCAAFPATAAVRRPSQTVIDALTRGNPKKTAAALFPSDRSVAYLAYGADISSYPSAPPASAATVAAQARAVTRWWSGTDPAGKRIAQIAAPTLIADGTVDRIDPLSNSRSLVRLIPGAKLALYPDAGHAFLFQDATAVAFAINSFLATAPTPVSRFVLRKEFLAGEARVVAAGKRWVAQLKALRGGDTSTQVAEIDERFANVITQFDQQLLSSDRSGLRAALNAFVDVHEDLVDDILATSATTASTSHALKVTFAKDGTTDEAATRVLRRALGLPAARAAQ
jgi:pimeloyl-ACP methyl ester carboxylesterase